MTVHEFGDCSEKTRYPEDRRRKFSTVRETVESTLELSESQAWRFQGGRLSCVCRWRADVIMTLHPAGRTSARLNVQLAVKMTVKPAGCGVKLFSKNVVYANLRAVPRVSYSSFDAPHAGLDFLHGSFKIANLCFVPHFVQSMVKILHILWQGFLPFKVFIENVFFTLMY